MRPSENRLFNLLVLVGPGILVAATGVGAGDLATAAFTGNKLGVAVLWAVVLGAFLKYVLNEGLARWQLATRETLLEGAIQKLGRPVTIVFLPYLILWSFFVGLALMSACGVAMQAIVPVFDDPNHGKIVFGVLHSILGVVLVKAGGFQLFKKVMLVCIGLMFVVVVTTAIIICKDWSAVASGLLVPRIPSIDGPGLGWTIALMGGVGGTLTVLCYGYWMRESGMTGIGHLKNCRIDLGFAYLATAIFGLSMVIIGGSIPELPPGGGATLVVQLGILLESSTGVVGRWAFLLGAWSAIFSSLLGVWQAVPYLFADYWRMTRKDRSGPVSAVEREQITRSSAYNAYLYLIASVPMLGLFVDFSLVQKVYAIFGALFMPMLALVLLRLNGKAEWVGTHRNRPLTVALLYGTLFIFVVFGFLQIRKELGI
ncbi:MAG: Nramp family divalent metal transporter [Puniceicoccaceae bacterium]